MITVDLLQAMWQMIQSDDVLPSSVPAQELTMVALSAATGHPLLVIDDYQYRHLLIPVAYDTPRHADTKSSGIQIMTHEWGLDDTTRVFVDVMLLKPHLQDLFNFVVLDILQSGSTGEHSESIFTLCATVLSQWRDLFTAEIVPVLDTATLVGLFGELCVLQELLSYDLRAILTWNGPFGAAHDFSNNQISIEVKTTQSVTMQHVTVHGFDQLDILPPHTLYLFHLLITEDEKDGIGLDDLVGRLLQMGCDKTALLHRLAKLKLTPERLSANNIRKFSLNRSLIYQVDGTFPKITRGSFIDQSSLQSITKLSYQVNLDEVHPISMEYKDSIYRTISTYD